MGIPPSRPFASGPRNLQGRIIFTPALDLHALLKGKWTPSAGEANIAGFLIPVRYAAWHHGCLRADEPLTEKEEIDAKRDRLVERLGNRIVRRVTRDLQKMKEPSMLLSGEDSGLRCVWDEICVQQQTEEGFAWSAYEATIRALIGDALNDLSRNQLCDLWLLTEKGKDWRFDHSGQQRPAPCESDVGDFLYDAILSRAANHSNARIRSYIDNSARTD